MDIIYVYVLIILVIILFIGFVFAPKLERILTKKRISKQEIKKLQDKLQATFHEKCVYGRNHKVIFEETKNPSFYQHNSSFSPCHNCFVFRNNDAYWEVFFAVIQNAGKPFEILTIRVFSDHKRIRSEALVESVLSQISILSDSKHLTHHLDKPYMRENLEKLVKSDTDTVWVWGNIVEYKTVMSSSSATARKIINRVKILHKIHKEVLRKDVIEY